MRQGNEINYILLGLAVFVLYEIFKAKPALPANVPGLLATSTTPPSTSTGTIPPQPAGPCQANQQWFWNGAYWACANIAATTGQPNTTDSWWSTVWGWLAPAGWDTLPSY